MVAVLARQQSIDDITKIYEETYKDLLRSYSISSPSIQSDPTDSMQQVHANCKVRLQTIALLFDAIISPGDFTRAAILSLQDDFLKYIFTPLNSIDDEYFNDKRLVLHTLREAKAAFANAITVRGIIESTSATRPQKRAKQPALYKHLDACVGSFDNALKNWSFILPGQPQRPPRPNKDLQTNLSKSRGRLTQIHSDFEGSGFDGREAPSTRRYEAQVREIIASLREIPEAEARIYKIRSKNDTIKAIRNVRKDLNLALDEFDLIGPQSGERQRLHTHLKDCGNHLDDALALWGGI